MAIRMVKIVVWLGILVVTGLGVRSCASSTPAVEPTAVAVLPPTTTPEPPLPTSVPPTDTAVPPSPTPAPPSATVTPEPASPTPLPPEDTATPEPKDTPTPEAVANSDNCIACHTSQETLQALAVDKIVESEATSGEG